MWYGLAMSTLVHLVLMGLALVSIQTTQPSRLAEPEAVAVAIISPDDLTRLMKGDRSAKTNESSAKEGPQAPPQPKEAAKPPPTPPPTAPSNVPPPPPAEDEIAKKLAALETTPPPAAKAEPPPPPAPQQPTPDEKKKVEDEIALELQKAELAKKAADAKAQADAKAKADADAKAKRDAEAKAAREKAAREAKAKRDAAAKAAREKAQRDAAEKAKREADAKKNAFDPSKIATAIESDTTPQALQNKAPPKGAPATTGKSTPDAPSKAPNAGAPDGRDNANTASLAAAVRARIVQQLATCWNINAGLDGANRLVPKVYFELNKDGSLRGQPRVENPQNTPEFNNAAEAAMRAVIDCAGQKKFADLPPEYYDYWARNRIDFNPASMFR